MKTRNLLVLAVVLFQITFFSAFSQNKRTLNGSPEKITETKTEVASVESIYETKTFQTALGWGYDVYKDGQPFINQPHIPAINGIKGFRTQQEAERVAMLTIKKLQEKKESFPSITVNELDSLGIQK